MKSWLQNLARWTRRGERRSRVRSSGLPLSASYWAGGRQEPYEVVDVSFTGAMIAGPTHWGAGTLMELHLHNMTEHPPGVHTVLANVVRTEPRGTAVEFLLPQGRDRRSLARFLNRLTKQCTGSSLVEFALVLPVLTLLAVNVVNFGAFFFAWITVANASRSAAQYASMAGATVLSPRPATAAQVAAVVSTDISSLLNRSSLAVRLCTRNGSTVACTTSGTGTFSNPVADARAEAPSFVMAWVDIGYTYQPVIPLFQFPGLGIHATLPTTTIHRQTVMRMLQ